MNLREGWNALWDKGLPDESRKGDKAASSDEPWPERGDDYDEDDIGSFRSAARGMRITESLLNMRLPEQIASQPFPNIDAGTEFDDRLFKNIEKVAPLDLPPNIQHTAQRLSLLLSKKNVRAKRAIELVRDFAWGEGPTFRAKDLRVQQVLNEHWILNQWGKRGPERVATLGVFGELLYPIFKITSTSIVKLSTISSFKIRAILRNPENGEDLEFVVTSLRAADEAKVAHAPGHAEQNFHDRFGGDDLNGQHDGRKFKIIQPTPEGRLEGEAFYFAVNRLSGATRGIPDLLSAIDWLEGLDSFIFSLLERANITGNVVWDLEIAGARPAEIRKRLREFVKALRKSGGLYGHNEKTKLNVKVPVLGSSEAETTVGILLRQIQAGTGLAPHFLNDVSDLTRSSAAEVSLPVAKMIQGRQTFLKIMLTEIFQFQIQTAKDSGRLNGVTDFRFEIQFPRILLRDLESITKSIGALSQALVVATEARWISDDEARFLFRGSVEQLGSMGSTVLNDDDEETTPAEQEVGEIMDQSGEPEETPPEEPPEETPEPEPAAVAPGGGDS